MDTSSAALIRRRPFVALILSVWVLGLGQVYNAQPRKAALLFLTAIAAKAYALTVVLTSPLLTGIACAAVLAIIATGATDAFLTARRVREIAPRRYNRWYVYVGAIICMGAGWNRLGGYVRENYVQTFKIPSVSMAPTLKSGDYIMVDMTYYRTRPPQRGDVVVLSLPEAPETNIVKRIVAVGGDTVEVSGMSLVLNGSKVETPNASWQSGGRMSFGPATVPPGSVFLLGDNRDFSKDSRHWETTFPGVDRLRGKVLYIYLPVGRAGLWVQ